MKTDTSLAKFAYAPKVLNALEEEGCVGAKLPLMCPRRVELDLEVGQQCTMFAMLSSPRPFLPSALS